MTRKDTMIKVYALWFNKHFNTDYSKVVFVNESGFDLHIQRSHGRSKIGTRENVLAPTVRGRSITLLASLNIDGLQCCNTISHSTVDGDILKSICMSCTFIYTKKKGCEGCVLS